MQFVMESKKGRDNLEVPEGAQPLARRLSQELERKLRHLAKKMEDGSEKLSIRTKKVLLFLFVIVFCGVSLGIIWRSVGTRSGRSVVSVQSIVPCPLQGGPEHSGSLRRSGVSRSEYLVVQGFHHYLDSLAASPSGMIARDSMLRERPGLLDSIEIIEKAYLEK